jgi:hypothetical protein
MLRSQHFFADYGHLIYVLSDGTVKRTEPKDEFNKEDSDPFWDKSKIHHITNFRAGKIQINIRYYEYKLLDSFNEK